MIGRQWRVGLVLGLPFAFSGCAVSPSAPDTFPQVIAEDPVALEYFTAGPGDVMVLSDRCGAELCDGADGAPLPGMTELVYLGMRSPREAVFLRRQVAIHSGPVRETDISGLMLPVRPEVPPNEAAFIPPRAPSERLGDGVEEIVVDPVAGVQLGAEHVVIDVNAVTPARLVYTVTKL